LLKTFDFWQGSAGTQFWVLFLMVGLPAQKYFVVPRPLPQGGNAKRGTGLTLAAPGGKTCNFDKIFKSYTGTTNLCGTFDNCVARVFPPFPPWSRSGAAATKCVSSVVGFFWRQSPTFPPPRRLNI
jgi:hypothetical protein